MNRKDVVFSNHFVRRDNFGRIVIDECPSDHEHLVNPRRFDYERSLCRHLFADLIPKEWLDVQGPWRFTVGFGEAAIEDTAEIAKLKAELAKAQESVEILGNEVARLVRHLGYLPMPEEVSETAPNHHPEQSKR